MKMKQADNSILTPPGYGAFATYIGYNVKCSTGNAINTFREKLKKQQK